MQEIKGRISKRKRFEEHYRKRAAEKNTVIFQSWTESREALHPRTHIRVTGRETFKTTGYEKKI